MQLWIVEHIFIHKKVPVLMNHSIWKKSYVMIHYYRYLFVKIKVFNYSELHISEVTSYKIPTLVSKIQVLYMGCLVHVHKNIIDFTRSF